MADSTSVKPAPRPTAALAARADQLIERNPLSLATTLIVIILASVAIWPRPGDHHPVLTVVVLLLNCVLLCIRLTRREAIPERLRLTLLGLAVLASTALLGLTEVSSATIFAFFAAGHAGFRLRSRDALVLAGATSILGATVLGLHHGEAPWYVGALTGVSVFIGMSSRARAEALAAAQRAAAQAERAAQAEARELALAERGRIARDVHDVLAHSLAGINMQLEVADALLDDGQIEPAQAATRRAQSLVRAGLTEVQRTVRALREDALPLVETLRAMLAEWPDAVLQVSGEVVELDVRVAQALVRCAQEALTNAHKYAPHAPLRVTLDYAAAATRLSVANGPAGAATRPLATSGSGMGLVGMRERVALVGGTVQAGPILDGADRGGWLVRVEVPRG